MVLTSWRIHPQTSVSCPRRGSDQGSICQRLDPKPQASCPCESRGPYHCAIRAHRLYTSIKMSMGVSFLIGMDEICSPDFVVIGKAKGITSSRPATLRRIQTIGCSLIDSWTGRDDHQKTAVWHDMRWKYLQGGLGICHIVEIRGGGLFFPLLLTESRNLRPDAFLRLRMFRDLPKEPR